MENEREVCSPFTPRRNPLRKTSAEIVREARQSLRVQSTHRPFTPSDGQRHLFGRNSNRVERDNRPPSAFSLHSHNFDAPDSRPGSGIRLSPLDHKPKFPVLCNAEDPLKAFPKPPSAPAEGRKGQTRARARLLKAASVSALSPVEGHKEVGERLNSAPGQKPVSAKQLSSEAHATVHHGPLKPDPRRAASESTIAQCSVDSEGRPTDCRVEQETGRGYGEKAASTDKGPDSLLWNDSIVPLLQQLESEAAGTVAKATRELQKNHDTF